MSSRRRVLVTWLVPGALRAELDGLRRALGSSELGRIPPHVTLVPPTNVDEDELSRLAARLGRTVAASAPLELLIGPVATFGPQSHVVFAAVGSPGPGDRGLAALRAALVVPPLSLRDERPFVPHITLANHLAPQRRDGAIEVLSSLCVRATCDRVALMVREDAPPWRWQCYDETLLGSARVGARGGLEVELSLATLLSAEDLALIGGAPIEPARPSDERTVVRARAGDELVAVAAADRIGADLVLETIVVARARRREGIGRQLISYLARHGAAADGRRLVASPAPHCAGFFRSCGFVPTASTAVSRPLLARERDPGAD